ncbi:MAG: M48 family metallopeptidase [bacterium]
MSFGNIRVSAPVRSIVGVAWLAMAFLLSCATTGPGGKQSLILIPTSQEVAIGAGMAEQVEATEQVLDDPSWQAYVDEVGQKIVSVCDRRDLDYHFRVIRSDQVNAFAAPGGYIYLYTGLLETMETEAEMASVIAHEISHVVARHSVKRLQAALGVAVAYELALGGEEANKVLQTAVNVGLTLAFAQYSQSNEREADLYGIDYMVQAGYDPNGALGMFNKLAALGGSGSTDVFEMLARSHPETEERIANAQAQISRMGNISGRHLVSNQTHYRTMKARLK